MHQNFEKIIDFTLYYIEIYLSTFMTYFSEDKQFLLMAVIDLSIVKSYKSQGYGKQFALDF